MIFLSSYLFLNAMAISPAVLWNTLYNFYKELLKNGHKMVTLKQLLILDMSQLAEE